MSDKEGRRMARRAWRASRTMKTRAHCGWCRLCLEVVGPPRLTIREADADLVAHRAEWHRPERQSQGAPAVEREQ